MSRILRIALVWLLAIALPVQGIAAAAMSHCGPAHHGAGQAALHAGHWHGHFAAAAMRAHPGHHAHGGPAHSHDHHDGAGAATGDQQGAKASLHDVSKTSCSACASCCTAAALPSAIATFEASPVHHGVVAWPPRAVAAFLTDGPDRPPRAVLA